MAFTPSHLLTYLSLFLSICTQILCAPPPQQFPNLFGPRPPPSGPQARHINQRLEDFYVPFKTSDINHPGLEYKFLFKWMGRSVLVVDNTPKAFVPTLDIYNRDFTALLDANIAHARTQVSQNRRALVEYPKWINSEMTAVPGSSLRLFYSGRGAIQVHWDEVANALQAWKNLRPKCQHLRGASYEIDIGWGKKSTGCFAALCMYSVEKAAVEALYTLVLEFDAGVVEPMGESAVAEVMRSGGTKSS